MVHRCRGNSGGGCGLYKYSGLGNDHRRYHGGHRSRDKDRLRRYRGVVLRRYSWGYYQSLRYIGVSRFLISAVS